MQTSKIARLNDLNEVTSRRNRVKNKRMEVPGETTEHKQRKTSDAWIQTHTQVSDLNLKQALITTTRRGATITDVSSDIKQSLQLAE